MSYRIGHQPLSSIGYAWLAAVSDPLFNCRPPEQAIAANEVLVLIEAASAHGVLPATARNLRGVLCAPRLKAEQAVAVPFPELDRRLVLAAGHSLLLMHHASRIAAAIADLSLEACIVKGPVFARRLYSNSGDRSFTDVDILVAPSSLHAMGEILRQLGFIEANGAGERDNKPSEQKWLHPGNDAVLVEVQTDLIHSARFDGIRLSYADLLAAGDGDPEDATALLLVAAVHGVAGHQFERLQPAVDLLQAVREVAGTIDTARLIRVASATGAAAALQTGLDVVSGLFDEREAARLADLVKPVRWRRLRKALLTPQVVLRSQANKAALDSWRRRAVREIVGRQKGANRYPVAG